MYYELINKDIPCHEYLYTTYREAQKAIINEKLFYGRQYDLFDDYYNTVIKFDDIVLKHNTIKL